MLIVISPAKTLDFESSPRTTIHTQPEFLADSKTLIKTLRKLSAKDLGKLMSISDKLAQENFERYKTWKPPFTLDNARQAVLAFKGDVYLGLNVDEYKSRDFQFAQKHLRILSGLYGLLRPLDLMQPYRLEMGTRLPNPRGRNLYDFWDKKIPHALAAALGAMGRGTDRVLVNLASGEYFKAVQQAHIEAPVITPVFKDEKNGKFKVIQFWAKKARGLMTSYIVKNRLKKVDDMKGFDVDGYTFNEVMSNGNEWVFTRPEA